MELAVPAHQKTKENLATAFANEAQAVQRYLYYASLARDEGDERAALLFEDMARNEQQHARQFIKLLEGERLTIDNLRISAKDENQEWKSVYPAFSQQALAEGLEGVSRLFDRIASIENNHEKRFVSALLERGGPQDEQMGAQDRQKSPLETRPRYVCMFCGHGEDELRQLCPVCQAVAAFEDTTVCT